MAKAERGVNHFADLGNVNPGAIQVLNSYVREPDGDRPQKRDGAFQVLDP